MGKIIYYNLLVDFAYLVRAHGLYPMLSDRCIEHSPSIAVAYNHIINNGSIERQTVFQGKLGDGSLFPPFERIRLKVEHLTKTVGITKQVKPLIARKNIIICNNMSASVLPWFYMNWLVWLHINDIVGMRDAPILEGGNYVGAATVNKNFPFDNLFMSGDKNEDIPGVGGCFKVDTMSALNLMNGDDVVRIPSHIALVLFHIVNTKVLRSERTSEVLDRFSNDCKDNESAGLLDILDAPELEGDGKKEDDEVKVAAKKNPSRTKKNSTSPKPDKGTPDTTVAQAVQSAVLVLSESMPDSAKKAQALLEPLLLDTAGSPQVQDQALSVMNCLPGP